MSEFTRCPHCGLTHSKRPEGLCPRCRRAPGDSAAAAAPSVGAPAVAMAGPPPLAAPGAAASPPKRTLLSTVGGAVGALIGVAGSRVFGIALLIPMVVALVTAVVLAKAGPARARRYALPVSVLAGHLGWMVFGALVLGTFAPVAIDVLLMLGGAAWLLARPGLAPVLAVGIFEVLTLAVNAWQTTTPQSAGSEKALVLHVLLRAAVIVGLVAGYVKTRAEERGLRPAALARTFE